MKEESVCNELGQMHAGVTTQAQFLAFQTSFSKFLWLVTFNVPIYTNTTSYFLLIGRFIGLSCQPFHPMWVQNTWPEFIKQYFRCGLLSS